MKKYTVLFVCLALVLPLAVGAAEFRSGETVGFNETVRDNVYAVGGMLNISGTVEGDLYVAGGTVNVMGAVTGDVVVAGGTIIITGKVGGDLRVGGGNITIGGIIGGELVAGGGQMNILPGTTIGGGAYFGAGTINMNGTVGRNLVIAGGQIALGSGLKVAGNFDYYTEKEISIDANNVKISGVTSFHQQAARGGATGKVPKAAVFAFLTIWGLLGLAGAVVLACLLFYIWKQEAKEMIETAFASPGRELLRGFVVLIVLPIAAIICLITVVGLPLGFLTLALYGALIILGAATTGLLWAALLAKYIFKRKETDINWWLIILAVIVLTLVKIIPFVGWLIGFLVFLVGFGVLSNMLYKKLSPKN